MFDYLAYAVSLRRELHRHPEIGFDLPKTLAVIRRELDAMGMEYTEEFGRSSIVATVNPEKSHFTIGVRADTDALPIQEKTGLPFSSENDYMHACGHDLHTAMLITLAKRLTEIKDQIGCRVKLLFTPAEEYINPGCKEMAEAGVMDDIDVVVACHTETTLRVGEVATDAGGQGGNSMGFTVEFFGTAAHACKQDQGVDAVAMAVAAYQAMQQMTSHEIAATQPRLLNIGSIHGGNTNNIICNYCKMFGSARTHSDEVSDYMIRRIREICDGVAAMYGGCAKVEVTKFLPFVINDPVVTARMQAAAEKVVGKENIHPRVRSLGGEDFAFLCRRKPGMQFRLGTRNDDPATARPGHSCDVDFDERSMEVGLKMFETFILDNQNGITF